MSYKFDSLMIILNKLENKEKVTVRSLMEELEVSERTVHRYLNTLQIGGFPIKYDRKRETYCFEEGYTLSKPDLTLEESLAFALSKKLMKSLGPGFEKRLSDIEKKLSMKDAKLQEQFLLKGPEQPEAIKGMIEEITGAIKNFRVIELTYKSAYSDRESVRKVEPYYLFFDNDIWYLRGYCHLRKELRTFALDRVISVRPLNKHFVPEKISPDEDISGAFGPVVGGKPVEVILRFDAPIKPFVSRKKWHRSQKLKELEDGGVEMRFRVNGLAGIKPWIYQWLPHVKVIAPEELKRIMRAELKRAIKNI
jgi:proteasome accessory factor B